jgi:hypothetical protein
MADKPRVLLVTEKHNLTVDTVDKEKGVYILEAIFAQFGVKNNNNRIYEESEYVPHLSYLIEQIKGNNLVGELDHPEKFDISLSNASHVIENLTFDKANHQVKGRIRLLDTPAGLKAQALIDGGVQISISSRSAGIVESDNRVKLRRIFTYDIVNNPGFANAQLNRVNESFGMSTDENADINLYDYTDKCSPQLLESLLNDEYIVKENKVPIIPMNTVSSEELDKYTQHVSTEFTKVTEGIDASTVAIAALQEKYTALEAKFTKLVQFSDNIVEENNTLSEKLEKSIQFSNYLSENLTKAIEYGDYLSENLSNSIKYSDYLSENLTKAIEYGDYLSENLSNSIKYSEYIAEGNDNVVEFANYIAENLHRSIEFAEHIAESLVNENKNLANYADYLGENLTKGILYAEHVAEGLTESQQQLENITEYTNLIGESAGFAKNGAQVTARELRQIKLNESLNNLFGAIEKHNTPALENKYQTITTLLSESNMGLFESLEDTKKQKVASQISAVTENLNEAQILEAINVVVAEAETPLYLKFMPDTLKEAWSKLDEGTKNAYARQAEYYRLTTEAQVVNFWETRELAKTLNIVVNESNATIIPNLGYSQSFVDMIKNSKF